MKKIIAMALVFVLVFVLTACTASTSESELERNPFKGRFTRYYVSMTDDVLVDNATGVCYLIRAWGESVAVTVMLDADGSPLIYKED